MSSSAWQLVLLLAAVLPHATAATIFGMYKPNRCYSCMSPMYEEFFHGGLDRFFNEPKNFTTACDDPNASERELDVVACRTICLTVQQDLVVMGQRTGRRLTMRGCALTLAKRGLHNHTLSLFDRADVCRDMNAADLFRHESRAHSQRVRACSCLGDRCNGALDSAASRHLIVIFALLLSLIR